MADAIVARGPCRKCGSIDRNDEGNCRACQKRRSRANYLANRERRLALSAAWKKRNREKVAKTKAAWARSNLEKVAAYRERWKEATYARALAWQAKNPERVKKNGAAYRAANKGKCNAATAAWVAANPEARRKHNSDRRARKVASGGALSKGIGKKLFSLQRGRCACCSEELTKTTYHLDHVMPLSKGGVHDDSNIQLLCPDCNRRKHAKHPIDFMQERGFLL